jgi:hypothetical protein
MCSYRNDPEAITTDSALPSVPRHSQPPIALILDANEITRAGHGGIFVV